MCFEVEVHKSARRKSFGFVMSQGKYTPNNPGEPVHTCSVCDHPIQNYGRLAPCNHIFCHSCVKDCKSCPSCKNNVTEVSKVSFRSAVYVCQQQGCYRSYLSKFSLKEHQRLRNHGIPGIDDQEGMDVDT